MNAMNFTFVGISEKQPRHQPQEETIANHHNGDVGRRIVIFLCKVKTQKTGSGLVHESIKKNHKYQTNTILLAYTPLFLMNCKGQVR